MPVNIQSQSRATASAAFVALVATVFFGSTASMFAKESSGKRMDRVFRELAEEAEQLELRYRAKQSEENARQSGGSDTPNNDESPIQRATFGNGCFWCTEAVFEELHGVGRVASGYSGGRLPNPTYKQVCTGLTGHAEVVHLEFDAREISFAQLLEVFFRTHDPTTLNKQGPDEGTQYRSVVFCHSELQRQMVDLYKRRLSKERVFRNPVVTQIAKFDKFYPAENYHQDFYAQNGRYPYCRQVVRPKLSKMRRVFGDQLKRNPKNQRSRNK